MVKEYADDLIAQYQKKIFGFAVSKTSGLQETEELSSSYGYSEKNCFYRNCHKV